MKSKKIETTQKEKKNSYENSVLAKIISGSIIILSIGCVAFSILFVVLYTM